MLMSCFKWGHAFYSVNNELLLKYKTCSSSAEVVATQNTYLNEIDSKTETDDRGMTHLKVHYKFWVGTFY